MRIVFQHELAQLQQSLTSIAKLVHRSIADATTAFRTTDVELAESVIERGTEIERECNRLDEKAVELLVTQAPVASDLRLIVTGLRMSSSLARMSDLAQHIANLARTRYPERAIPKGLKRVFVEMGERDTEIAAKLVEMIESHDPRFYDEIERVDDLIDDLHVRVFEKVLSDRFTEDSASVVDATLASRYHERFGDHAVTIAKQIHEMSSPVHREFTE